MKHKVTEPPMTTRVVVFENFVHEWFKKQKCCCKRIFHNLRQNSRRLYSGPAGSFSLLNVAGMELNGRHKVNAPPSTLWTMLMDADVLSKIVPGISKLEKTGENSYKSTLEIKIGPVSGSFTGNLQMEDIAEPAGFTLKVQQNSKLGNANSTMKIQLVPVNPDETEVVFGGDVKITGLLASMGQRVLGGVANLLTKQFFANLDHELAKQQATQ